MERDGSSSAKERRITSLVEENNRLRAENAVLKFKLSQTKAIADGMTVVVDWFDRGGERYVVTNDGREVKVYGAGGAS